MYWRTKAWIQSQVARLPERVSNPIYYQLQRRFGNLRPSRIDPTSRLRVGLQICNQIRDQSRSPVGATFFEVGTGWRVNLPIACWLCGANRVITVDRNRYLRFPLVQADLAFLRRNHEQIFDQFQNDFVDLIQPDRWEQLVDHIPTEQNEFITKFGIEYHGPSDASRTSLRAQSIDFHVSCNVLEHVSPADISSVFREAARIVKPSGLLVHLVDHSDHFAHSDRTLSPVHFLRYSDAEWRRLAGNRFAHVNRLREDDYVRLFASAGLTVEQIESNADPAVVRLLARGFDADPRFRGKSADILARLNSWFVLSPRRNENQTKRAA